MKKRIQQFTLTLLLALALAGGIGASTSAMAFANTSTPVLASTQKTFDTATRLHTTAAKTQNTTVSCTSWIVPGGPYALAAINKLNPSIVVYLEAIPYGPGNLTYYVWKSFNGFPGNPIEEPQQAPGTFVYDIYIAGYVGNTPAANICSDWTVYKYYVRMY